MVQTDAAFRVEALDRLAGIVAQRIGSGTPDTDLERLFHGRGRAFDGLEGVIVDRYANTLRVGLHGDADARAVDALARAIRTASRELAPVGAWLQWRGRRGAPLEPLFGAPARRVEGREDALRYLLRPGEARNAGLFLDARDARRWLRAHARGQRVLNLFAYTCGFSLAALAGGAAEVVNVDAVRSVLDIGKQNHALNDLQGARFLPHDVHRSWGALRRRGPFDLVVLDPPTFQRGSFEADRDWPRVLRRLPSLLRPGGGVLVLVNSPFIAHADIERWRREAAPDCTCVEHLPVPEDFPETEAERGLKVQVWRRAS